MPLKLSKTASLGQIACKAEHHGAAVLTAAHVQLSGIPLDARDLEQLLPGYQDLHLDGDSLPWSDRIPAQRFGEKIEQATIRFDLGEDDADRETYAPVAIASIVLEAVKGGASMSCQIQMRPALTSPFLVLLEKIGRKIDVTIQCDAYGSQGALDLPPASPKADDAAAAAIDQETDEALDADATRQIDEAVAGLDPNRPRSGQPLDVPPVDLMSQVEIDRKRRTELLDKAEQGLLDDDEKAELKELLQTNADPVPSTAAA